MIWVVDDGPLGRLARRFSADWRWPAATLDVVESVASAAAKDKSGRTQKLLAMRAEIEPVVRVHSIGVGTPAADYLFSYLRMNPPNATVDFGEHESLAYCMAVDSSAVFVTEDKRAAFLALAELGPARVATPFDLWRSLFERELISAEERQQLDEELWRHASLPGIPRRLKSVP